jgi:zinc D-Ala-D-Ala carboxypeptidase
MTPHFTLAELTASETAERHDIDNTPTPEHLENLQRLAEFLETVKTTLGGKPVMINSAYRGPAVNEKVGGSKSSQHMIGCAADIRIPGMNPDQVCRAIIEAGLPFDQLIREFDSWTHISITNEEGSTPRGQTLIIDRAGTRPFV